MNFLFNNNCLYRKNGVKCQEQQEERKSTNINTNTNKKTYHIYKELKINIIVSLDLTIDEIIKEIKQNPTLRYDKVITSKTDENKCERVKISNDIVLNTQFICHRINTIEELKSVPEIFGVEIDIRDIARDDDKEKNSKNSKNSKNTKKNKNQLVLAHDPYPPSTADSLNEYLKIYTRQTSAPIIMNIKSERIEPECLTLLEKNKIHDFFFLDSSFPMIYYMNRKNPKKTNKFACRISEHEPIESFFSLYRENMISHVWIDCFTKEPLTNEMQSLIQNQRPHHEHEQTQTQTQTQKDDNNTIKICIVSPELQGQPDKIEEYRDYFIENKIIPDMICCKLERIIEWI